jgi:hypothetical protein
LQLDSYGNVVDYTTFLEGARHLAFTLPLFSLGHKTGKIPDVNRPIWQQGVISIARSRQAMEQHFAALSECMEGIQSSASLSISKVKVCVGAGIGETLAGTVPCQKNLELPELGSPPMCKPELCGQADCSSGRKDPQLAAAPGLNLLSTRVDASEENSSGAANLGRLSEGLQLCATVFSREVDSLEVFAQVQASVDKLRIHSQRIQEWEQILEAQSVPLEVVQSMIRIHSARLDGDAKQALDALSTEIESVCSRLVQSINRECTLVRLTRLSVGKMNEILVKISGRRREADKRQQAARQQITQLEEQGKEQGDQRHRLAQVTRRIQDAVFGLVQGLQFQDIVGQRLAQVESSLQKLSQTSAWEADLNSDRQADPSPLLFQLQQQVQQAETEMSAALGSLEQSLLEVQQTEQVLHFQLKQLLLDRRRREMKSQLQIAFDAARTLAKQNHEELQALHKLVHPILRNAQNIGQEMGGVGAQLRRTALNAQVQSARFGDETGLDVVVHSLSLVADEITRCTSGLSECAASVLSESSELRDVLDSLTDEAIEIHAEGEQMLPKLQEQCNQNEMNFRDSILSAIATLEHLSKQRTKMERVLSAAQRPLRELDPLAHRFALILGDTGIDGPNGQESETLAADMQDRALSAH